MPSKTKRARGQHDPAVKAALSVPTARDSKPASDQSHKADEAILRLSTAGDLIPEIRSWHRQRCFAMEQRKRLDLALGSFLRMMLGWRKDLPEPERNAIAKQAAALMKSPAGEWQSVIDASLAARGPFDKIEATALKNMERLAEQLPAWAGFGESIRGFGRASLAVIIAEAGDLSNYSNPAKLWKRMGLAVMGDVRQGGLAKGAGAEAWIAHGYSPMRRSRMWNIGDALIKSNKTGEYRTVYIERKAYELARDPQMQPIKAHRRAQRYMEKRLLKKLWQAWRRATDTEKSLGSLPADELQQAVSHSSSSEPMPAERPADARVPSKERLPGATHSPQGERSAEVPVSTSVVVPSAPIPAKAGRRATRLVNASSVLPADKLQQTSISQLSSSDMSAERSARQKTSSDDVVPTATHSPQGERSAGDASTPIPLMPSAPVPAKAGKRKAVLRSSPVTGVPSAF